MLSLTQKIKNYYLNFVDEYFKIGIVLNSLFLWSKKNLRNVSVFYLTTQCIYFFINLGALKVSQGATISCCNLIKNDYKNPIH